MKKFKYAFILLLFFGFIVNTTFSQNKSADLKRLSTFKNDTSKIEYLIAYFTKYYTTDDSIATGLRFLLEADKIATQSANAKYMVNTSYELGSCFSYFKDNIKSTEYYYKSLKLAEKANIKDGAARANMGIGLNYYVQKNWKDALLKFEESIRTYNLVKDSVNKYTSIYLSSLVHIELRNYSKAIELLNTALAHAILNKNTYRVYECKLGLARADIGLKNYENALSLLNEILPVYEKENEKVGLALIHYYRGTIYFETNKTENALNELIKANNTVNTTKLFTNALDITALLSKIYSKMGDSDLALHYLKQNLSIRDTLYNRDISAQISLSNANYEFEKKETILKSKLEVNEKLTDKFLMLTLLLGICLLGASLAYYFVRKAQKQSEALLLNILPKETAAELKKFGKVEPKNHKNITILFCDIENFTRISENLTPKELVNMLDKYFGIFDHIIEKNGLEKIKTIGDAYMCAGGLHKGDLNFAKAAVNAAIEMAESIKKLNTEAELSGSYSFNFRIGINTGNVVSGVVGTKKYAYDIWGDTVNIAARMEQNSVAGKINISEFTYALVKDDFKTIYRGKLQVKNKEDMAMYFIEN